MCVKYNITRFICVSQEQQQTNDTYVEEKPRYSIVTNKLQALDKIHT